MVRLVLGMSAELGSPMAAAVILFIFGTVTGAAVTLMAAVVATTVAVEWLVDN